MKQNQTQFEWQRAFIGLLICFIVVFVLNKTSHNKLFIPALSLVSLAVFSSFADDFLSAPYYCQFTYNLQIAINLIARIKTFPSHCNATFFCFIDVKHTHTPRTGACFVAIQWLTRLFIINIIQQLAISFRLAVQIARKICHFVDLDVGYGFNERSKDNFK